MNARLESEARAREWLQYGDSDLLAAEYLIVSDEPRFLKIVAFHVQQAIEKYSKGLLVFTRLRPHASFVRQS
ncbi:MAG: HEPN domain-containing protein [Longimicrobiales bacterium]